MYRAARQGMHVPEHLRNITAVSRFIAEPLSR